MSKKKQETLALFRDSFELTQQLTNEQFGILMRAVYAYRFLGEDPEIEDPVIRLSLGFVTAQVDRYEEYCRQNRDAANARYAKKKEAREEETGEKEEAPRTEAAKGCENEKPSAEGDSTSTSTSPSTSPSTSTSMSSSPSEYTGSYEYTQEKEKLREAALPPHTQFSPPTVEQVQAYCKKAKLRVDARRFVDYYTSIGWVVGKSPIRDWTAVLRNWNGKEKAVGKTQLDPEWTIGHVL